MAGKLSPNVIAAIGIAVLLAVCAVVFVSMQGTEHGSLRALVHDSDGNVHELSLRVDAELPVVTELGANTIVVEDGSVYVRDADCENLDCVHQGRISTPGRQIICLPHKLWIEVVAQDAASGQMDVNAVGEEYDTVAR